MSNTQVEQMAATSINEPSELNERELGQVAGGLLPAVGPASAKKTPTAVEDDLIGCL